MRVALAVLIALLLTPAAARADAVIDAINDQRARRDLPELTPSATLERSAEAVARRLMREQRFDHDPVSPAGFDVFGEALMLDFGVAATAEAVVHEWMASPEHRALLLSRSMRQIGAGAARGMFEGEAATIRVVHLGRAATKRASEPSKKRRRA